MSEFRSPHETALLLAAMLKRSGENYATVSQNTLSRISNRKRSGQEFTDAVEQELGAFGIALIPVSIHSYGLMRRELFKTCLQITPESCATLCAELDAAPDRIIPAKISYVADVAQFTPKTVETQSERQKLMFRLRAQIDPALLKRHVAQVKTGLPGMAYVRIDPNTPWPADLAKAKKD